MNKPKPHKRGSTFPGVTGIPAKPPDQSNFQAVHCPVHGYPYQSKDCPNCKPQGVEQEIKGRILRPLADKFIELAQQYQGGERKLPKTLGEAETITESYIQQAYERLEPILTASNREAVASELKKWEEVVKPEYHGALVGRINELTK